MSGFPISWTRRAFWVAISASCSLAISNRDRGCSGEVGGTRVACRVLLSRHAAGMIVLNTLRPDRTHSGCYWPWYGTRSPYPSLCEQQLSVCKRPHRQHRLSPSAMRLEPGSRNGRDPNRFRTLKQGNKLTASLSSLLSLLRFLIRSISIESLKIALNAEQLTGVSDGIMYPSPHLAEGSCSIHDREPMSLQCRHHMLTTKLY